MINELKEGSSTTILKRLRNGKHLHNASVDPFDMKNRGLFEGLNNNGGTPLKFGNNPD